MVFLFLSFFSCFHFFLFSISFVLFMHASLSLHSLSTDPDLFLLFFSLPPSFSCLPCPTVSMLFFSLTHTDTEKARGKNTTPNTETISRSSVPSPSSHSCICADFHLFASRFIRIIYRSEFESRQHYENSQHQQRHSFIFSNLSVLHHKQVNCIA